MLTSQLTKDTSRVLELTRYRPEVGTCHPVRGPPFDLRGGGRVSGMDQNILFTMIPQIYTFFWLLGHQIIYFTFTLELFQLYLEGNYLFQQLAATNYLFYQLLALNYLRQVMKQLSTKKPTTVGSLFLPRSFTWLWAPWPYTPRPISYREELDATGPPAFSVRP